MGLFSLRKKKKPSINKKVLPNKDEEQPQIVVVNNSYSYNNRNNNSNQRGSHPTLSIPDKFTPNAESYLSDFTQSTVSTDLHRESSGKNSYYSATGSEYSSISSKGIRRSLNFKSTNGNSLIRKMMVRSSIVEDQHKPTPEPSMSVPRKLSQNKPKSNNNRASLFIPPPPPHQESSSNNIINKFKRSSHDEASSYSMGPSSSILGTPYTNKQQYIDREEDNEPLMLNRAKTGPKGSQNSVTIMARMQQRHRQEYKRQSMLFWSPSDIQQEQQQQQHIQEQQHIQQQQQQQQQQHIQQQQQMQQIQQLQRQQSPTSMLAQRALTVAASSRHQFHHRQQQNYYQQPPTPTASMSTPYRTISSSNSTSISSYYPNITASHLIALSNPSLLPTPPLPLPSRSIHDYPSRPMVLDAIKEDTVTPYSSCSTPVVSKKKKSTSSTKRMPSKKIDVPPPMSGSSSNNNKRDSIGGGSINSRRISDIISKQQHLSIISNHSQYCCSSSSLSSSSLSINDNDDNSSCHSYCSIKKASHNSKRKSTTPVVIETKRELPVIFVQRVASINLQSKKKYFSVPNDLHNLEAKEEEQAL